MPADFPIGLDGPDIDLLPPPDPWVALEQLVQGLNDATAAADAVRLTVESVREAVGADAAFWYSVAAGKVTAIHPDHAVDTPVAVGLARNLLHDAPPDREVIATSGPPAALMARSPRSGGCVVAVRLTGKPFDPADGKAARLALRMLLGQRTQALAGTRQLLLGLVHTLTTVIDAKDPYTAGHSERVARIAVLIAEAAGLTEASRGDVFLAGLIHDVGKIAVRDDVLQKPGKLTADEYAEVKEHPLVGDRIVASIKPFEKLRPAVRHHHERWDGTGYPDKLAGEAIPLVARILAVADACDAMMSPRRYRPGLSPVQIDAELERTAGKQFDPAMVAAFMTVRANVYPPIYQKGIGDSAYHAIDALVQGQADGSVLKIRPLGDG
jgi:HD-GYP domain-containing protein (c-di-GMP phosphodiesterase class II)